MNKNPPAVDPVGSEALSRGAMRHELALRLLKETFAGRLPAGHRLMVVELTKRFGTSSTPVREALIELAGIGVVDFVHNRGAVVRPFGPKQLREIYQLRRILETEAARTACGRISAGALAQLREDLLDLANRRHSRQWLEAEMAVDRRLHATIAGNCGSIRLEEEIGRYDVLVQTTREVIGFDRRALLESTEQHLGIVDALIAEDAEAVATAMSSHVEKVGQCLEAAMAARK